MRVTVRTLKRMIREAVGDRRERVSATQHPKTFNQYRKWIASIASQAGASADIVDAFKDMGDRGSKIASGLYDGWRAAAAYFETGDTADVTEGLEQLTNVHDVLLDIGCHASVARKADDIVSKMVDF